MISRIGFLDDLAGAKETFSQVSCRRLIEKFGCRLSRPGNRHLFALPAVAVLFSLVLSRAALGAENNGDLPVWLIKNNWKHNKGLPKNFRKMHDSLAEVGKSMGKGLESLNASGSAQCSRENFEALKNAIGPFKITVLDLRQEPHGFVNKDLPVSWYQGQDQINWGKTLAQIEADEARRLEDLEQQKSVLFYDLVKPRNSPSAAKVGIDPERVEVSSAFTESSICGLEHMAYVRLPVANFHSPDDECVDEFVKMAKSVGGNSWLHMHAGTDDGRTTTFMVMYDMMHNADKVSFNEIIERQQMLGGIDLLQSMAKQDQNNPFFAARTSFIQEFYNYCIEEIPHKFTTSWSDWKATNSNPEKK